MQHNKEIKMKESSFQFINYIVSDVKISITEHFAENSETFIPEIETKSSVDENDPRLATIKLIINIKTELDTFNISFKIEGLFKADNNMNDELFEKMCKINAPAILLPYARSIITNFTALCNIQPIILPLFNLTEE